MRKIILGTLFSIVAWPAFAACPVASLTFKDAGGTTQTICFDGSAGQYIGVRALIDATGAALWPNAAALSDALGNPTTTLIGAAGLGWDATNSVWRRLQVDAGTGTVKVDGSGATQPISGTVSAQLQDGSGNAITSTSNALDVNIKSGGTVADGSTSAGQGGSPVMGNVTTAAPSYTPAQTNKLSLMTDGSLRSAVEGMGASGATVVGNPVVNGGRAATTQPTAVTDGQAVAMMLSSQGKVVAIPYAPANLRNSGSGSSTTTAAITVLAASGNASFKEYLTDLHCGRSDAGTTAITLAISDGTTTITVVLPDAGNGAQANFRYTSPLAFAANTAVTVTPSAGVMTLYCDGEGYNAP